MAKKFLQRQRLLRVDDCLDQRTTITPRRKSERAIMNQTGHRSLTIVRRYIRDGEPVGSQTLARHAGLDVSPATIRNILADLEDIGLLSADPEQDPDKLEYRLKQAVCARLEREPEIRELPGFLQEAHPKLRPVETLTAGVFSVRDNFWPLAVGPDLHRSRRKKEEGQLPKLALFRFLSCF